MSDEDDMTEDQFNWMWRQILGLCATSFVIGVGTGLIVAWVVF